RELRREADIADREMNSSRFDPAQKFSRRLVAARHSKKCQVRLEAWGIEFFGENADDLGKQFAHWPRGNQPVSNRSRFTHSGGRRCPSSINRADSRSGAVHTALAQRPARTVRNGIEITNQKIRISSSG